MLMWPEKPCTSLIINDIQKINRTVFRLFSKKLFKLIVKFSLGKIFDQFSLKSLDKIITGELQKRRVFYFKYHYKQF